MSYVDAHLHLADPGYSGQVEALLRAEANQPVRLLLSNATDYETSVETVSLAGRFEGRVLAAVGVHPWSVVQKSYQPLERFEHFVEANRSRVSAIGEIGLDGQYSREEETVRNQMEVFQFFLRLAEQKKLPVVVHSRLAVDEALDTLSSFKLSKVLMHWYSGPTEKLGTMKDRGYYISIGPSVSYSKRTAEIAKSADLRMILSETDGPVKYHGAFEGKDTEPSFVVPVVRKISELKMERPEIVRDIVWNNFQKFIG